MARLAARWLFCLSTVTWAACGSDRDRVVQVREQDHCGTLRVCVITSRACQEAILALTACVRGDEVPELPAIRTISREQLATELSASTEEEEDDSSETRAVELAFAALQLIASETEISDAIAEQQEESLAAFYRRDMQDVTVISDTAMHPQAAMNALSHELTHYLQDLAGQLERSTDANSSLDEIVAGRALTEGEAVVTSYRTEAAIRGLVPADVPWNELWSELERSVAQLTEASDSPLIAAANLLPYVISPATIELAWERGGRNQVDGIFDAPPITQLDWLEGTFVLSNAQELDCYPALPPDGYELIMADSLGVAGLFALLGKLEMASLAEASAWRQDRLAVYMQDDADDVQVLAAWRIRFADASSASDFKKQLETLDLDVTRADRELLVRVSSGPDTSLDSLDARSCPSSEQFAATALRPRDVQASLRARPSHLHPVNATRSERR
jgi:hypothetical protein